MAGYDVNANGPWTELGKGYDVTVNGVWTELGKGYDVTVTGVWTEIYSAEETVTLTNRGMVGGTKYSWSDSGTWTQNVVLGNVPDQRCWIRINYGGWSYGGANVQITHIGNVISGPVDINGSNTNWKTGIFEDIVTWQSGDLLFVTNRTNASQGATGLVESCMIVPLTDLDNALGRQATLEEVKAWYGTNWTGSKTVTIQT